MKWFRDQREKIPVMDAFKKGLRSARNEEGQAMVLTALSLTVLLGFVALATDAGVMLRQKRIAQSVADSAAIAGAFEALYEGTPSTVTTGIWNAASKDATLNGYAPGTSNGSINSSNGVTLSLSVSPNVGVSGFNSAGYVQANVTFNSPTFFMTLFNFHSMNVSAVAIASDQLQASGCFDIQNGGNQADPAATMGGSSEVFGLTCGVTINGNVDMGGNANIDAKYVAASGTIVNGGSSSVTGTETQGAPPTNDPLPQLQQTANQPGVGTTAGSSCGSTLPAGAVADGMSCIYNYNNGNLSNVTLQSNTVYVFDNNITNTCGKPAIPCVELSGTITGTGDTIFLKNNLPLEFDHNGSFTVTAPRPSNSSTPCELDTANPFCGVLIDAPSDGSVGGTYSCSHGKGNNDGNPGELYFDFGSSNTTLTGVVYAPYMQLYVQDQGANTTMNNDVIIGNFCAQAATVTINGLSPSLSPLARIGLVY
ncbi:MAG TPA: pilus assembly protein TadG-related protein [Terracidiphilus sp.]|nr:pilus assembly protein TadG-related protein [Terracidiphilus sp.]